MSSNITTKENNSLPLFPILFAIAIIPCLVRFSIYDPQIAEYSWYTNTTQFMDIFVYHKRNAVMFLDAIFVITFIYLFIKKKLPKEKTFLSLAAYAILILLSSFVSVSPYHTWNGFPDMLESAFVLLGYCMLCYYTYVVVRSEQQIKVVIGALFIGMLILGLIGVGQFFGQDFFMTDFGKNLLFSEEYSAYKDTLSAKFEVGRVSTTLYNPNYVGVYTCILAPFLQVLAFSAKKQKYMILYIVLLFVMLTCLAGSGSKTAVLTVIPCMAFTALYFGRLHWKKIILVYLACALIFTGLNIYQGDASVFHKAVDRVTQKVEDTTQEGTSEKQYVLSDITLNDENFTITYGDQAFTVRYLQAEDPTYVLEVYDAEGAALPLVYSEEKGLFYIEGYENLGFTILKSDEQQIGYQISSESYKFNICYSPTDETYYYLNNYGRYTKLYSSEKFDVSLFHLMGGFSGRHYIWGKSVPILKETFFLGSGPDTYAFMFPQYDYVDAARNGFATTTVTKPHNIYLQIGIQTGVLSLIAYLAFYMCYFVASIRLYWKRELCTFTERCGAAIFIASISYMIAGLINDSTIGVSVVFWSLMGLGHACNLLIKKSEMSELEDAKPEAKKWKTGNTVAMWGITIIVICVSHYLMHRNDAKPTDGRAIFETNAIQSSQEEETIPYQAVMSIEWTFLDGTSISSDAYVENVRDNQNDVYFDVKLESGELIYTSPIVEVGTRLENIALDKQLAAGEYIAVVTYHLLDEKQEETATAQIAITIKVLN